MPKHWYIGMIVWLGLLGPGATAWAQTAGEVHWLRFEQLDDSLRARPRPVLISFYTDWCVYCKKMEREVFSHPPIVQRLNRGFYALRMDAEQAEAVTFDGQRFDPAPKEGGGGGFHELALLLGSRNGQFTPPVTLLFNEQFELEQRLFTYIPRRRLLELLDKYGSKHE